MNDGSNAEFVARHCARIAGFCRDEQDMHEAIIAEMIVSASRVSMCIVDFDLSVRASKLLTAVVAAVLVRCRQCTVEVR